MHWMNGNVSRAGLTKDLEAMAENGIGGFIAFSVARGRTPEGPVAFGSDEWFELVHHAGAEAERLGLDFGLHNCDGWSSSGGPWITPAESMKRVVASFSQVSGGTDHVVLPKAAHGYGYYEDIALLAWPSREDDTTLPAYALSGSGGDFSSDLLRDADRLNTTRVKADASGAVWLQVAFAEPVALRSIFLEHASRNATATLQTSDDGERFETVAELESYRTAKSIWTHSLTFAPLEARFFRVLFSEALDLHHLEMDTAARIPAWIARSFLSPVTEDRLPGLESLAPADFISPSAIRILPGTFDESDGIALELPAGWWTLMRMGCTTTGASNHPSTAAGKGLECDKLDSLPLDKHFAAYLGKVQEMAIRRGTGAITHAEIDSFEMGGQNWTQRFAENFEVHQGYPLIRFLPLLVGIPIGDATLTGAVLEDVRCEIADLMARNYFQRFTELCHEYGILSYIEPYGLGSFNFLDAGAAADLTMGEFWSEDSFRGRFEEPVSSARMYGKSIISAESFTAWSSINWRGHPAMVKRYGDHAWAQGVNETMFHRFAHQANPHVWPGMSMGDVGSHIDRTQTWWDTAGKAWFTYLARGSYMLRQGHPVSDVLVFVGDSVPQQNPKISAEHTLPAGFNHDFANANVLKKQIRVENGRMRLAGGSAYSILLLENSAQLRPATLARLEALVKAGVQLNSGRNRSNRWATERRRKIVCGFRRPSILCGAMAPVPVRSGRAWCGPGRIGRRSPGTSV